MLGYFALLVLFLLLFSSNFYFGIREWLRPQDAAPLPVDVEYVRTENYFGTSFRAKMREWMKTARSVPLTSPREASIRAVLEKSNGERILVLAGGSFGGRVENDELIYCEGDLRLPEAAVFHGEIYCLGGVESGAGAQLQAVAADGGIVLGLDNRVSRWVDARSKVLLRRGTTVDSRVSSMETIELEQQVSAQSLYAPLIFTAGYRPASQSPATDGQEQQPRLAEAPAAATGEESPAYLDGFPSSRLGADTWLVRGNLELRPGARVDSNLVVQGTLRSGAHCRFSADVKAGCVALGPDNRISGNLVSGGALEIGQSGQVGESVVAERDILLRAGARVGGAGRQAVVSAGRDVKMEANVAVCGKVAAGRAVVTV